MNLHVGVNSISLAAPREHMEARNHSRIGAVILAAGMSSRMGETKQLLRLGGQTLLEHVLENVRAVVSEAVLVLGHAAEAVRKGIATGNVKVVVNHAYRKGMGSSLRAGISVLPAEIDAALIVLADQPFVRPATLTSLMDRYRNSSAQIVIPMYRGFRGNPVLLDRSVFPEVMELSGDIGCRAIFGNHLEGIVKLPVDDPGILIDVDSKEDFEKLKEFSKGATDEKSLIKAADLAGREIPAQERASHECEVVVVGREPVGIALCKIAKLLNYAVTLVDPLLKTSETPEADRMLDALDFSRLPASSSRYVVVASRGKFDEEAVEQALHSNSAYVALVANKRRAQEIQRSLQSRGERPENLKKVHAPAGLEIGARTPEEIALSIMAEIVSLARKNAANTSAAN
jgi:molybdenum cofactor cytidylyltransferase